MARTSTSSNTAKPVGVNRKAVQKAAREKKRKRTSTSTRRSSAGSRPSLASQHESREGEDDTILDLEDIEEDPSVAPTRRPFIYLKAKTRRIPQDKITSEWKALTEPSADQVKELLTIARRSVVSGARSKKKALVADQAVESLMGQLLKRLPRMPFPPKTNEKSFDLDKLLEQNRTLENDMTATIHSIELLKAEIEKQTELLHNDQTRLRDLEQDAKQEVQYWESQTKKKHPLIDSIPINHDITDSADEIGLISQPNQPSIFDTEDQDIQPILEQLRNHMDSIKANSTQVETISEVIRQAGISLDSMMMHERSK